MTVQAVGGHEYTDEQTQELVREAVAVDAHNSSLLIKTKHPFRVHAKYCPMCGGKLEGK
ncbi:hypothetical protein LSI01_08110 [Furfurilactobacillus siliginis]|uniref:Uncharacterized protein n=2 Tax=Furfurilactobacillus siliginis TaxID=348151 RepID=A0A510VUQ3_9LACO|nr:hypothetical protein LSI01_08110 [Furfurilactobacillus siliginis]